MKHFTKLDQLLIQANQALQVAMGPPLSHQRPNPASSSESLTDSAHKQHAAGLMRINHTGEVCAQALYSGQAFSSKNPDIKQKMQLAADEELDHLAWCAERLAELNSQPSKLNLFWYTSSWLMGACAGLAGDKINLGFLEETERQVEAHLDEHLQTLPEHDYRSREIVAQMKIDEAKHADMAQAAGAVGLPTVVKQTMQLTSKVMKGLAYRI